MVFSVYWRCFRYSFTKAFCIAFVMTFFPVFDVPVFWPILLCYWVVLFVLTMRRQIAHMIKFKYIPFNIGKQVRLVYFLLSLCIWQQLPEATLFMLLASLCHRSDFSCNWFLEFEKLTIYLLQRYGGKKSSASSSGSRGDWSSSNFIIRANINLPEKNWLCRFRIVEFFALDMYHVMHFNMQSQVQGSIVLSFYDARRSADVAGKLCLYTLRFNSAFEITVNVSAWCRIFHSHGLLCYWD